MELFEKIKAFFERIFRPNQKLLEAPKCEAKINDIQSMRNSFEESLRVILPNSTSSSGLTAIESLQCINDGLGFQKIKNY